MASGVSHSTCSPHVLSSPRSPYNLFTLDYQLFYTFILLALALCVLSLECLSKSSKPPTIGTFLHSCLQMMNRSFPCVPDNLYMSLSMQMWYQNPLTQLSALRWCWALASKNCSNPIPVSSVYWLGSAMGVTSKRLEGRRWVCSPKSAMVPSCSYDSD